MLPSDTSCAQRRAEKSNEECVAISKDGRLLPETIAIIALVKKYGLVLASGHASPDECVLLAREAQRQGVPFTVTHVNLNTTPPMLDAAHVQEVAKAGRLSRIREPVAAAGQPDPGACGTRGPRT